MILALTPLAALGADRCDDPRYPALAGEWVVGCDAAGAVDVAVHAATGARVALDGGGAPALGPGVVYAVGRGRGLWRLPDPAPTGELLLAEPPIAPPATDGETVVLAFVDHLEVFPVGGSRVHVEGRPLPWYPPAVAGGRVAWVERRPGSGEDIRVAGPGGAATWLAAGPGDQRHVIADGDGFAWVDGDDLVRERGGRTEAAAGFDAPPTADGTAACWEDRAGLAGGGDIDIVCTDLGRLVRPGDQRAPSRHGEWLLFREGRHLWLARLGPAAPDTGPR